MGNAGLDVGLHGQSVNMQPVNTNAAGFLSERDVPFPGAYGTAPASTTPVFVGTIPPEQVKPALELDEDLVLWLVDQSRAFPDYHAWCDKVTNDNRVDMNTELLTVILANDNFFNNIKRMQ